MTGSTEDSVSAPVADGPVFGANWYGTRRHHIHPDSVRDPRNDYSPIGIARCGGGELVVYGQTTFDRFRADHGVKLITVADLPECQRCARVAAKDAR